MGQAIMTMRLDEDKILRDGEYDLEKLKALLKESREAHDIVQISETEFEGSAEDVLFEVTDYSDEDWIMENLSELKITFKPDGAVEDILQLWKDGELDI